MKPPLSVCSTWWGSRSWCAATGTFAAVPGAHGGGHPAYRSALLLDDLLLLDVVLEGTRVGLVAHRGLLGAGRCELLLELAHGLLEPRARLVLELLRLADRVQETGLLATQVVEELGLEAADVLHGHGVELAAGAGPDRDDLLLHRERRGLLLLEQLDEPGALRELGPRGGVEVGGEHGEGLHRAELREVELQ